MIRSATALALRGRSSGSRRQAILRQGDQLGVGPAGVEPGRCVGQVAQRRLALDLAGRAAQERRLAGEDLAEDRAQGEDIGPLVDPVDLAASLLGSHVAGRAHHRAGVRQVGIVGAAAGRGDHGLLTPGLAGLGVVDDAAAGQDLGQAPVHHLDLAERADHHVRRFQIAVDHPPGVGVGDGLGDRLEDGEKAGQIVGRDPCGLPATAPACRPLTSFIEKNGRRSPKVPSS